MTWTKLGDEFTDECWRLSDAAFRLHTEGLCWSNRKHLDGCLVKDDMSRWAHCLKAAEELVDLGFWEDHSDHYQIYAHQGWQRTAEQWLSGKELPSHHARTLADFIERFDGPAVARELRAYAAERDKRVKRGRPPHKARGERLGHKKPWRGRESELFY